MLTNVYLGSGHNGNQEDALSSRQFGQQSFNYGNEQALKLGRCKCYLRNLKLSMTDSLTQVGAIASINEYILL